MGKVASVRTALPRAGRASSVARTRLWGARALRPAGPAAA